MQNQNPLPEIIRLLESAESKLSRNRQKTYGQYGLTSPQISILLLLDQGGPMKITQIAEALRMIQSNTSNICSRLEKAGLITRERLKEDQRVVNICLTDTARSQIPDIRACVDHFHQTIEENMTTDDFEAIKTGLIKLNQLFDLFAPGEQKKES